MKALLIANRGEIAVRIVRAAEKLALRTVAVFSEDDAGALHTRRAGEARGLRGRGASAYLDMAQLLAIAAESGCDALHPGYGFLSENAALARRCREAGLLFVGPQAETLEIFGDKARARALAERCAVPVLAGSSAAVTLEDAARFLAGLGGGPMVIKAVAGGGGRGMRVVRDAAELEPAFKRCQSEARAAFGNDTVYVERFMPHARHIEIQILGDRSGAIIQLGERECSIQRRHQKLIEIAPCPSLSADLRERLAVEAVRLAEEVRFENAGTFEFLVDVERAEYAFIEANPRLQVEHTVTEEVLGLDLVKAQLQIAAGRTLAEIGLAQSAVAAPRGYAIELRINAERMEADGSARGAAGTIAVFAPASGPGVRVDTAAHDGYEVNPRFDSLLAKLIVHSDSAFEDAVAQAQTALAATRIDGADTNIEFLARILQLSEFVANRIDTQFVERHLAALLSGAAPHRQRAGTPASPADPLAVLEYGKTGSPQWTRPSPPAAAETTATTAPQSADAACVLTAAMPGSVVSIEVAEGERVHTGQALLVLNAMKMEHVIDAPTAGVVSRVLVAVGDTIAEGQALAAIAPGSADAERIDAAAEIDLEHVRPDLAEMQRRHAAGFDAARPDAVERRRKTGQRTARANLADLCDPGTFVEYGGLAIAAQRQRRSLDDLIARTPADGLIAGVARINGDLFERAECAVLSYDYSVLAGTQGWQNHRKKDRLFELAERQRLPVVIFTEGGGGRPGDTDAPGVAALDCMAFHLFGRLSGLVPLIGINSGRCFAGNAALLGCCDVVIAARDSNIGMGGPAMIEGGGLGVYRPEEVGPMAVQVPNGVVDIAVADEAEAVAAAKRYLSYFQGAIAPGEHADQRRLRAIVPENRLRVYDVRAVIETLADSGSVLELRRHFGLGMVTALIRIDGRPLGVIANNPTHLAGAIDSPGADKASRFMQLCDAFDIPILFLCDTPGIMVGPEVEKTALVRHCCRMFVTGANLTVPFFTIVLRKSYGLGAQAMAGGSHKASLFTVAWPTGEFGGMGLEGAVKLGFRKELAAIEDADERRSVFEHMVKRAYEHGAALNVASHFEIDDVIDPADSRDWILTALRAAPPPAPRSGKKRPCVDTW